MASIRQMPRGTWQAIVRRNGYQKRDCGRVIGGTRRTIRNLEQRNFATAFLILHCPGFSLLQSCVKKMPMTGILACRETSAKTA